MEAMDELQKTREDIIYAEASTRPGVSKIDSYAKLKNTVQHVKVKEIKDECKDIKTFILEADREAGTKNLLTFEAGEYISITLKIDDEVVTRSFSLSSSPKEALKGIYKITVKKTENGKVSNYMHDRVKVGYKFIVSKPGGHFTYKALRDESNIIGIAGGSGVTPFISMASSIIDGDIDAKLTVFLSVKTYDELPFKEEINRFNKSKKVKFVVTLTREDKKDYLNGHISLEMIKPALGEFNTIFMCGPTGLYKSMNSILEDLDIPRKSVHYETFNVGYIPDEIREYELKLIMKDKMEVITCKSNETLLESIGKAGIVAPAMCHAGTCGFCKSVLIDGKVKSVGDLMPISEEKNDYIHPCVCYPVSDIALRLDI